MSSRGAETGTNFQKILETGTNFQKSRDTFSESWDKDSESLGQGFRKTGTIFQKRSRLKCVVMELKEFKEFNGFIEAKPLFRSRAELIVWLFAIRNAVATDLFWQRRDLEELKRNKEAVRAISTVDLERVVELVAKYGDEKDKLTPKDRANRLGYLSKVLLSLERKALFQLPVKVYAGYLEKLGYGYLLERYDFSDTEYTLLFPFEAIDYGETVARFYFTERVAPLVLEIKKWFTLLKPEEVLRLRSVNSQILYRIARRYLGVGKKTLTFNLETLNFLFNTRYKRLSDFKKRVLNPAVEEINRKTSLSLTLKPVFKGRGGKLVAVKLLLDEKNSEKNADYYLQNGEEFAVWVETTLSALASELGMDRETLTRNLIHLKRTNIGIALRFILSFPEGLRKYAFEKILSIDIDTNIQSPNALLLKLTPESGKYNFLTDERIEALLRKTLGSKKETELDKVLNEILNGGG